MTIIREVYTKAHKYSNQGNGWAYTNSHLKMAHQWTTRDVST